MNLSLTNTDYFEIFSLKPKFHLDMGLLDANFRDVQSRVHPDKAAHLGDAERRLSMQWATLVNEAYQTLKKPVERASYLLRINGVETHSDGHAASLSQEFLIEQMEWREELQKTIQTGNINELGKLERGVREKLSSHLDLLGNLLDNEQGYSVAANLVKQIRFLDRLLEEINNAYEMLEG
ncbi:MAG: Fe-S protein assembly co-chaperone HscB [Methylobacter sp.]|nr:MAG: Fe-S protein assembly co-chaperone HscB [Methylobacter sp.]PPD20201.1 MAG: Fe-S protein assembly co-chaperone HscB [Methylobacter sp.]